MRIGEPARKHGVADPDIEHAYTYFIDRLFVEDNFHMLVGPARDGALLEIGVLNIETDDENIVIHAAPLRSKFLDRF